MHIHLEIQVLTLPKPDTGGFCSEPPGTNTGSWFEAESLLNLDSLGKFSTNLCWPSLEPDPLSLLKPSLTGRLKSGPPKNIESPEYINFSACCPGVFVAEDEETCGGIVGSLPILLVSAPDFGGPICVADLFLASEADTGTDTYLPASWSQTTDVLLTSRRSEVARHGSD